VKNNSSLGGISGGGASPAGKPNSEVIINPPYNNKIQNQEKQTLFLTNIRSFQQNNIKINNAKEKLRGKKFRIRKTKPYFCKNGKVAFLHAEKGVIKNAKFTRVPCNSWTCPDCYLHKALYIKYYFREVIQLNNLAYFLTLTLDPKKIPSEYANNTHKYITKIFNHFITILKRDKANQSLDILKYVWVIEFQKNGNAHMHILLNKYLPITVVRKLWMHVGGGIQMKILPIKTLEGMSNYISDYIVKGIKGEREEKPYGFNYFERRYSISRSCKRPEKTKITSYSKLTFIEKIRMFEEMNLEWVYKTLYNLKENDIIIKFQEEDQKT
jgi:hypothetical protein